MQSKHLAKSALLALALSATFVTCMELFWRSRGYDITFNDDKALWAEKRKEVYKPAEEATVFIGSSRIKFDLDLPTWRKETGEEPVQLSLVGTSPLQLLKDLADDKNFRGKLVVDITEVLFFSQNPAFHKSANEAISFYHKQTPSEKLSSSINMALESNLVFLEERRFALNTLLTDLELKDRPGVFTFPAFPKGFEWTTRDRQTYMSTMFLTDSKDVNRQTGIWQKLILGDPTPPIAGNQLQSMLKDIKSFVDKISDRGGRVLFVRTPSSGPMADAEEKKYPRRKYWDILLEYTGTPGIHYLDDPATAAMICPEWSHLSPYDAIIYTKHLISSMKHHHWFN